MVSLRLWLINLYIWIFWGVFSNVCLKTLSEMNVSYIRYAYIVNFFQSISNLGLFMKENHESHTLFIDQLKTVKSCKFVTFFFSFYCVGLLNHIGNTSTSFFCHWITSFDFFLWYCVEYLCRGYTKIRKNFTQLLTNFITQCSFFPLWLKPVISNPPLRVWRSLSNNKLSLAS